AKMLGPRLITGFVLDEFIVDKADAVTREYSQDLTVAFTLRNHGAIRRSASLVRCAKSGEPVSVLMRD
ncbi:MAG TPA: hypothetical protein VK638_41110, partial [Edaphobacter sp.]|nr:hypothetical protein [Edaphobacter sp.]